MSTEMPSPPEVAEIDAEIEELTEQVSDLLYQWRWMAAGIVAIALICGLLIAGAIASGGSDDWMSAAVPLSFLGLLGLGALASAANDNRNERIQAAREQKRLEISRREILAGRAKRSAAPYARYKEHLPALSEHLKLRAQKHRRAYVAMQLIIIVGSLAASAVTAQVESPSSRNLAVVISLAVGITASCSLTFRIRERGDALQLTATRIEREYRAAELRLGEYAGDSSEEERFRRLAETIESIRDEQARTERSLDQPPDTQQSASSGI